MDPHRRSRLSPKAYRDEKDVIGDFLDERCVLGAGEQVTKSRLYEKYVDWSQGSKERPLAKITFGKTLGPSGNRPRRREDQWRRTAILEGNRTEIRRPPAEVRAIHVAKKELDGEPT